ncbi:MAG: M14 family zinc carboxypeptidase [Coprothermobacterota bacterium]|nr:M14 family zinc carboxypeptidase [Coprothermobacterota bacterium]
MGGTPRNHRNCQCAWFFRTSIAMLLVLTCLLVGCGQGPPQSPLISHGTGNTPSPSTTVEEAMPDAAILPSVSPSPIPLSLDHFHSLAEYETILNALSGQPLSLGLRRIGSSIEQRPIWALGIGSRAPQKEALIVGLTHGCEWLGGELALALANALLNPSPEDKEMVAKALLHTAVWIVPVLNPDGYVLSGEGDLDRAGDWRKNVRLLGDPPFDPARDGVDLNRNFSTQWEGAADGIGAPVGDSSYPGTAPFSEPETQALRDFTIVHRFFLSVSLHSYGDLLYFPWGFTEEQAPDFEAFASLAEGIANRSKVEVSFDFPSGYNPGNSDDYLYGEFGTYAFTMEIGEGYLIANEILPSLLAEKLPGLLFAIQEAAQLPSLAIPLSSTNARDLSSTP